jgi:anion-transporting  ArsA/GET3 family ATPase
MMSRMPPVALGAPHGMEAILDRRLLIVSGKGGVGKTTVSAALSLVAARHGRRVLLAEVEGKGALASLFGARDLGTAPTELRPGIYGMTISPEDALTEYFDVQFHLKRLAKPITTSQLAYYVTHAAPGLRDILMLGKVWYSSTRRREFDLIVLDAHANGHVLTMLRSPDALTRAIPIGPLAGHAQKVANWLRDPRQVSVNLVTVAEEMPVNETVETTKLLASQVGLATSHVFVNMLYPPAADDPEVAAAIATLTGPQDVAEEAKRSGVRLTPQEAERLFAFADFYRSRHELQQHHRRRLVRAMGRGAPIVDLPFLFRSSFGQKELELLADEIEERVR